MSHDSAPRDEHRGDGPARGDGRSRDEGAGQGRPEHGQPPYGPPEHGQPRHGQEPHGQEHYGPEHHGQEHHGQGRPGGPPWPPAPGQPWGPEVGAFWGPQWGPQWGPGWSSPQAVEGRRHADNALILGILSVVVLPLLGPFALWQAREAEKLGISATAGKVLGWVGTVMIAVFLVFVLLWLAAVGFFVLGAGA